MINNNKNGDEFSYIEALSGFKSQAEAYRFYNIPRSTFSKKLIAEIAEKKKKTEKPRIRVKAYSSPKLDSLSEAQPQGPKGPILKPMFGCRSSREPNLILPVSDKIISMTCIGDVHGHPSIEEETTRCLKLACEQILIDKPEIVLIGGDFMDWSSVCPHEKNQTWRGKFKPTIREDLDTCRNLLKIVKTYLDKAGIKQRIFIWGNHEDWLHHFENENPEAHGEFTNEVLAMFEEAGFSSHPYGEYVFIGGVGFTHAPKNKMDRPVGGVSAENTVAMQSTHDVVFFHTHVWAAGKRIKFGYRNAVTVLNGGSTMPSDYVGDYAQRNMGAFIDTGIMNVDIADGRIIGHSYISMKKLETKFGEVI